MKEMVKNQNGENLNNRKHRKHIVKDRHRREGLTCLPVRSDQ